MATAASEQEAPTSAKPVENDSQYATTIDDSDYSSNEHGHSRGGEPRPGHAEGSTYGGGEGQVQGDEGRERSREEKKKDVENDPGDDEDETEVETEDETEDETESSSKPTASSAPMCPDPISQPSSQSTHGQLTVQEHIGDLFTAPDGAVLVHACNTMASWSAGIALQFRKRYPAAFAVYKNHCLARDPKRDNPLTGTALLIPPCEKSPRAPKHWIGCLFTSARYGKAKDPPRKILVHTAGAVTDLLDQVSKANQGTHSISEVRMCEINSGLFAVPWEDTMNVLGSLKADWTDIHIYSLAPSGTPSAGQDSRTQNPKNPLKRPPPKIHPTAPPPKKQSTQKQSTLKGFFKQSTMSSKK